MENKANKRIDAGIKRGPRTSPKPPERLRAVRSGPIPQDLSPDTVLERYLTEETTSQIAASYGTSRKTLVRWLTEQRPKEWKQVQVIRALCRKEDADEGMETASDALSLARAREMLKSGQWDLERLDSSNYGQKQEVTHALAAPTLSINIVSALPSPTEAIEEKEINPLDGPTKS